MSRQLEWLDALQGSGIRPGLQRMRRLLRAAGDPHRHIPAVLVAGTNGKGSTAATLTSIAHEAGIRVGLYTSPHLVRLNERWRIDDRDASDAELEAVIGQLREVSERAALLPTYFEALTLVAFLFFRSSGRELAVLEVGMGGRLDATNVVKPIVSIVTNVEFDHQEFLGTTLRRIAREKAGVIHRGTIALTASRDPVVLEVLTRRCEQVGVSLRVLQAETRSSSVGVDGAATTFRLATPEARYRMRTPLTGAHQVDNVAIAVRAAEELRPHFPISKRNIESGVAHVHWSGRGERFSVGDRVVLVDGAHNPAGARALIELVSSTTSAPRTLVFAAMSDKDWRAMLTVLRPGFDSVVCTIADAQRGEAPATLAAAARELGLPAKTRPTPVAALEHALAMARGTVVVAGSLYSAGAVIPWLRRRA